MPNDADLQVLSIEHSNQGTMAKIIEVAAGLICHDGRYLIAKRRTGVHLAGLWEFPGGKREQGETLEECLQRELFEELSIRIDMPVPFHIIRHEYPEKTVELHFFRCSLLGTPMPQLGQEMRWVPRRDLASLRLPPADDALVRMLLRAEIIS